MKSIITLLSLMLLPAMASADTLTLKNGNRSINGTVRYADDIFYVVAEYRNDERKYYEFPRSKVAKDEINETTYNQGAPDPGITAFEFHPQVWATITSQTSPHNETASNVSAANVAATSASKSRGTVTSATARRTVRRTSPTNERSSALVADDKIVMLANGGVKVGSLIQMTAELVTIKENGIPTATSLSRDNVKSVIVGSTKY